MRRIAVFLMSCALTIGLLVLPAEAYDMGKAGEYQTISIGGTHTAAIKTDGSLWVWGRNDDGQVGNGGEADAITNVISHQPTPVKVLDNVVSVSCGKDHTAAVKADGSLWVWGSNEYGQIGINGGNASDYYGNPIQTTPIKVLDNVSAASCGDGCTAAIKTDGTLWIWGDGNDSTPKKIMDHVSAVSCYNRFLYSVIKNDGTLWVWGYTYEGDGYHGYDITPISYTNPIKIDNDVASISCGGTSLAYVKKDGTVWTWGSNSYGQRGDGTLGDSVYTVKTLPIQVQGINNAVSISCGKSFTHIAVVLADGSLWMWGSNYFGELGNGLTGNEQFEFEKSYHPIQTLPVKIMDQVASAFCGSCTTAVIKRDGSLWTWGNNSWNVLGYQDGDRGYTISGASGNSSGSTQGSASWSAQTTPKQVTDFAVKPSSGTGAVQPTAPAAPVAGGFTDVPNWCADAANWAMDEGIAQGYGGGLFGTTDNCTNAQILTFLWRAAGMPAARSSAPFAVASYYQAAVEWAYGENLIDAAFQPDAYCTRASAMMYIWRVFGAPSAAGGSFTDVPPHADYATAVSWAVSNGITNGTGTAAFSPNAICNRGEIVTFLHRAYVPTARLK